MQPSDMRLFSNMLTFNRVKDGEDGKQGPMPVNTGQWNKDVEYIKDEFIQPYVWQIKNGKKLYYLLVAERSLGDDPYTNNTQGNGDIWRYREEYDLFLARKIQADDIDVDNLVVRKLKTKNSGARIDIEGSEMKVYGTSDFPNIVFGVNDSGYAVLAYYSNEGELIYDLGPRGINWGSIKQASWTKIKLVPTGVTSISPRFFDFQFLTTVDALHGESYWRYFAGSNPTISEEDKAKERYVYNTKEYFNSKIDDGWYTYEETPMHYPVNNTGGFVKPFGDQGLYGWGATGVRDIPNIYYRTIMRYSGGRIAEEKYLCWNGDNN